MGPTVRTQKPPTLGPRRGIVVLAGAVFLLGLGLAPYPFVWAQSTTYSETFESPDLNGDSPAEDWYTFTSASTGTFRVATDQFFAGSQSYRQSAVTTSTSTFTLVDIDLCAAGTDTIYKAAFRVDTTVDDGQLGAVLFRFEGAGADVVDLDIPNSVPTTIIASVNGDGTASTATLYAALVADTWYQLEVRFNCEAAIVNFFLFSAAGAELANVQIDDGGALTDLTRIDHETDTGSGFLWLDNIQLINAQDAPAAPPTGATATAAVVGLVGFDVDRTGTTVIARTGSGGGDTDVKTFSGLDLALLGTVTTGCDRADGVSALKNHVLFADCFTATSVDGCNTTGVGTDVSCIRIRSASLGVPVYDPNCDGCPENFGMSGGEGSFSDFPDAISLGKMEVFPYDLGVFENTNTPASSCVECTHAIFSLGFSTTTGRLGVLTLQYREGEGLGEGDIRRDEVGTLGSSTPNDFCSAFDGTRDYVGGALTGVPSRALNVDYSEPFEPDAVVVPVLTQRFVASGTVSGGTTFDCGTDRIVTIASTGQLYVLFASNGTVVNTFPSAGITIGSSCGGRAATISGNGDFIAWCDDAVLKLAHADNGTLLPTTFSAPTGVFKEMKFTFAGQTLFATSTTQIATYAVGGVVPGVPVESEEGEGAPPPPPAPGGLLGGSASGIAAAFEISSFGANLFMGALLMGLVSVGVGTGGGSLLSENRRLSWNWPAALVGAVIGFLVAWGFGFFTTTVVFTVVALCTIILSVWFMRGRG